jgi:hypothetical protein
VRRLFWIALGATLGVLLFRKVNKTIDAYSPAGVGRSLNSVGDGLRELAEVVREGMAEREEELRVALGVDAGTLSPEAAQSLMQDPSGPRSDR